jgi:hypothetical protein
MKPFIRVTAFVAATIVVTMGLLSPPQGAWAQANQTPPAFYGTFKGTGVAKNRDSIYFAVTVRDLDVRIHAAGAGFRVQWTTIIRRGGDPGRPNVRRKSTTRTLVPISGAGAYRCADSGDPLIGREMCWARIRGNTLSLFLMSVDGNGTYELQQYDRTLTLTGMKLIFKRLRDGEEVRVVSGRLAKTGN